MLTHDGEDPTRCVQQVAIAAVLENSDVDGKEGCEEGQRELSRWDEGSVD